eukprot:g2203.t1
MSSTRSTFVPRWGLSRQTANSAPLSVHEPIRPLVGKTPAIESTRPGFMDMTRHELAPLLAKRTAEQQRQNQRERENIVSNIEKQHTKWDAFAKTPRGNENLVTAQDPSSAERRLQIWEEKKKQFRSRQANSPTSHEKFEPFEPANAVAASQRDERDVLGAFSRSTMNAPSPSDPRYEAQLQYQRDLDAQIAQKKMLKGPEPSIYKRSPEKGKLSKQDFEAAVRSRMQQYQFGREEQKVNSVTFVDPVERSPRPSGNGSSTMPTSENLFNSKARSQENYRKALDEQVRLKMANENKAKNGSGEHSSFFLSDSDAARRQQQEKLSKIAREREMQQMAYLQRQSEARFEEPSSYNRTTTMQHAMPVQHALPMSDRHAPSKEQMLERQTSYKRELDELVALRSRMSSNGEGMDRQPNGAYGSASSITGLGSNYVPVNEARGFGKGLSSLHSGIDSQRAQFEMARKEQYARELQTQIDSKLSRATAPRSVRLASTRNIDRSSLMTDEERHFETEKMRREALRKQAYANELQSQIAERKKRDQARKEKERLEDEQYAMKIRQERQNASSRTSGASGDFEENFSDSRAESGMDSKSSDFEAAVRAKMMAYDAVPRSPAAMQ